MDRRGFLKRLGIGAGTAAGALVLAPNLPGKEPIEVPEITDFNIEPEPQPKATRQTAHWDQGGPWTVTWITQSGVQCVVDVMALTLALETTVVNLDENVQWGTDPAGYYSATVEFEGWANHEWANHGKTAVGEPVHLKVFNCRECREFSGDAIFTGISRQMAIGGGEAAKYHMTAKFTGQVTEMSWNE